MSTENLVVRGLWPSDQHTAVDLLADAFAGDPVFVAIFGGEDRDRVAAAFRIELAGAPDWAVDVATLDDVVVGVGLWHPPSGSPRIRGLLAAAGGIVTVGPRASLRAAQHDRAVSRARPSGAAWHLSAIGVSSAARGRGVGGLLLDHRLGRIDADSAAATLEATTDASRRLYERHGFQAVAPVEGLPGTTSTMMRRPPA